MITPNVTIQQDVLLSELSTFGIGGPADYFSEASSLSEIQELIRFARTKGIPILPIGKGSNCLFADEGFRGLAIRMKFESLCKNGLGEYQVGSGFSFAHLGRITAQDGFRGLEFAAGIPASVGGAIFMNAGASGQETKDYLQSVDVVDEDGRHIRFSRNEMTFAYRSSCFQKMKVLIVSATFQLEASDSAKDNQKKIVDYRLKTQPYKDKSCGCIFRNPTKEISSGKLIEESGLKGFSVGGAEVSNMHANFIVNKNYATSSDVQKLIQKVQEEVFHKTGYMLESEVRVYDQYGTCLSSKNHEAFALASSRQEKEEGGI